jgi:hypothetical protein
MSQVRFRDLIEDNWQKLLSTKAQLRDLQTEENRRLREETSERWKRKLQDKAKEKARIEENKAKSSKDKDRGSLSNDSSSVFNGIMKEENGEHKSHEEIKQAEESNKKRQEFLKKEKHLLDEIHQLQSKCSMCPLGRDRYYRRYWIFKSLPGLFVENDNGELVAELNTLIKFEPSEVDLGALSTSVNDTNSSMTIMNMGGINSSIDLNVKANVKNESDCSDSSNNENMNGKENNPKLDKETNGQGANGTNKFNNKSFNSKQFY